MKQFRPDREVVWSCDTRQLAWRDFYAHVLLLHPENARQEFQTLSGGQKARLEDVELRPFRHAIEARVAMIMTAHVLVPYLPDDSESFGYVRTFHELWGVAASAQHANWRWNGYDKADYLSSSCKSVKKCSVTLRHRNHVHISLTRAAGRGELSWYTRHGVTPAE